MVLDKNTIKIDGCPECGDEWEYKGYTKSSAPKPIPYQCVNCGSITMQIVGRILETDHSKS